MDGQEQLDMATRLCKTNRENWNLNRRVADLSKIKWVINTFRAFKPAVTDDIVPALLQNEVKYFSSYLCSTFTAYGYITRSWRWITVMFIHKPRKPDYTETKSYHSISLSSFLLKRIEQLVDRQVRAMY
jgi:hypothetical protein